MPAARRLITLSAVTMLLVGCGGSDQRPEAVDAPDPPLATSLPKNYRVSHVWRRNLTAGEVPEAIVTAVGPPTGELGFHPATLQVLSWDKLAKRWNTIFDAQRAIAPDTFGSPQTSNNGPGVYVGGADEKRPILDPEANVEIERVEFGSLLSGREQLMFSSTLNYGGSGVPQILVVVDFDDAKAGIVYAWYGEGLMSWRVVDDEIRARSYYWTIADAHCCPSREYAFAVGADHGSLTTIRDERPYLGVLVRETGGEGAVEGPLEVIELADGSPAKGSLALGDVILDVANAAPAKDDFAGDSIFNKLSGMNAGDTAKLVVRRGGRHVVVPVELGSLRDAYGLFLPEDDYSVSAL